MEQPEPKRIEVDLRHRETEAGWQRVIDRFALEAAPKWFEWLGWVLVLSAFQFVADQSGRPVARLVPAACGAMLLLYFNAFFFRVQFKGWPGIKSQRAERAISVVLSGLLSTACWFAATFIARIVAEHTK